MGVSQILGGARMGCPPKSMAMALWLHGFSNSTTPFWVFPFIAYIIVSSYINIVFLGFLARKIVVAQP